MVMIFPDSVILKSACFLFYLKLLKIFMQRFGSLFTLLGDMLKHHIV